MCLGAWEVHFQELSNVSRLPRLRAITLAVDRLDAARRVLLQVSAFNRPIEHHGHGFDECICLGRCCAHAVLHLDKLFVGNKHLPVGMFEEAGPREEGSKTVLGSGPEQERRANRTRNQTKAQRSTAFRALNAKMISCRRLRACHMSE